MLLKTNHVVVFINKLQFLSINEQASLLFKIQYALINRYAAAKPRPGED